MKNLSFEFVKPRNIRPLPCVQYSACVDEEMAPIPSDVPCLYVGYLHVPLTLLIVPFSTRDELFELAILPETVLVSETGEVVADLV